MPDDISDELRQLLAFLREMNDEAQTQARNELLPPILRSHSFGMSDAFEIALKSVNSMLERLEAQPPPEPEPVIKTDVLGKVAHELRSPLTSILGFSSTLLADDMQFEPNAQRQFLEIIDVEAQRMSGYLDHLMDWSRLQDGSLSFLFEDASLAAITAGLEPRLRVLAHDHALQMEVAPDLPPVKVDRRRVEQVLLNLVGSVAVYTPNGTPILISAQAETDYLRVNVADHGAGLPPEVRARAFLPYQTLLINGQSKRKSLGLELPISKAFVERHGGVLWIEDNPQGGTTLAFTLPVAQRALPDREVEELSPSA